MAVIRQGNWLGQQRVDAPALRMLESAVCGDFDLLAGKMVAGELPVVVRGFTIVQTGAVGNDAEALVLQTAGASCIHYEATDSGSIFDVPDDRANEVLSPTNPRVSGSFTPSTNNFISIDLTRQADDTTADVVQFLTPTTNQEKPKTVPLARTMDYKIVISTTTFSATPGLLPIAKIVTNAQNKVTSIEDSRWLMFRLGAGGSSTNAVSPFSWPAGRDEALSTLGGDRSIFSLKEWINATMTKLWEIGGGEYWYSLSADRNVCFAGTGANFVSTGEPFEWDGTNLHWQVLKFVFDNSTDGYKNEVAAQIGSVPTLTDLTDGQCIYVDLDRTQNRTVALANALVAQKGTLQTLGGSTRPGQRQVLAWCTGSQVYMRDQPYPIGGSLKIATTLAAGTVKTSVNPDIGVWIPIQPVAAIVDMDPAGGFTATAGGLSHNTDDGSGHLIAAGNLLIGRGEAAGDHNILLTTTGVTRSTTVIGAATFAGDVRAAALNVELTNTTPSPHGHVAHFGGNNGVGGDERALVVENTGALHIRNAPARPITPLVQAGFPARMKLFGRASKISKSLSLRLMTAASLPGSTAAGAGIGKTLTGTANGALTVDGVLVADGDRIGVKDQLTTTNNGIYVVTHLGTAGTPFILTRATDGDEDLEWPEFTTVYVLLGTANSSSYWILDQVSVDVDVTPITFTETDGQVRDQICVLWHDGSVTVIAESPAY